MEPHDELPAEPVPVQPDVTDPRVAAAERAYDAGDFRTLGRSASDLPGPAAARWRQVVATDPAAVYTACACLVLFGVLVYRYVFP